MKNTLISIVVPIYNVEKYLDKCINSLIKQKYEYIEIILVDDGSIDNCPAICDKWKEKDSRIIVIHKENGGLSDARNTGIEIAKGTYICFVDSDDYVDETYVEKLYNAIEDNNVNISQCGIDYINDEHKIIKSIGYDINCLLSGRKIIEDSCNEHYVENEVVWNRLYKTSLFETIKFPKGKLHEDEYTTYKLLYNENNIAIVPENLYKYRQSNNSIMRSKYSLKKFNDFKEAYNEKINYFKERNDIVVYDMVIRSYLSNLSNIYIKIERDIQNSKQILRQIKNEYKKYYKYTIRSSNISIKNKVKVTFFFVSPKIYTILKNIQGRMKKI